MTRIVLAGDLAPADIRLVTPDLKQNFCVQSKNFSVAVDFLLCFYPPISGKPSPLIVKHHRV